MAQKHELTALKSYLKRIGSRKETGEREEQLCGSEHEHLVGKLETTTNQKLT